MIRQVSVDTVDSAGDTQVGKGFQATFNINAKAEQIRRTFYEFLLVSASFCYLTHLTPNSSEFKVSQALKLLGTVSAAG